MADMRVAGVVAKVMKEEGVEWYAGVHGGHVRSEFADSRPSRRQRRHRIAAGSHK